MGHEIKSKLGTVLTCCQFYGVRSKRVMRSKQVGYCVDKLTIPLELGQCKS